VLGEVEAYRIRYIGEYEGEVAGEVGEDDAQGGERRVDGDSGAWDGTVRERENRSDGVDVLLDLSRSTPLVELVLPKTASVGQPRRVEDANQRLPLLTTLKMLVPYHCSVLAR
jgi:hypothetical protein